MRRGHADPTTTGRVTGWRRWLPALAFAFVVFALVALAVAPAVFLTRLESMWTRFTTTTVPAQDLVTELRFQYEREAAAVRGYVLSGNPVYLDEYREAHAVEEAAYDSLAQLARRIGPEAVERLEALREIARREHVLLDALADGTLPPGQFVERLAEQEALLDATQTQATRLETAVRGAAETRAADVGAWLARQRVYAVLLGLVALVAVTGVGWFARRLSRLSAATARAAAEERRLRELAERRREDVERITESRARLMRGFSHDVKNPLGAADGYLQLLEEGILGDLSERQHESIGRARRSIGAALHLIQDLLELARAESGAIQIEREPVDVPDVVRDAADEYRAQAAAKGLAMTLETPDELPAIASDADRIRQIVGNLLSNAVKFTDHGGVAVRAAVRSDDAAPGPGHWIAVDVRDTGPGIPADQMRLLFHEFARLSTGEGRRGAGIGLAISRRIARSLGGDITVESEVGRGSTFTLWLPLRARESEREQRQAAD